MSRIQSFKHAFKGAKELFRSETNAQIHLVVSFVVVVAGLLVGLNKYEWSLVILSIGFVIALEAMNTSIELLCNYVCEERKEAIRKTKDIAASAVLVGAIAAATVGLVIFLPHLV